MKQFYPDPNHPAYIKGFQSGMRGVMRPRPKFLFGLTYRENTLQFRYGREAGLAARDRNS